MQDEISTRQTLDNASDDPDQLRRTINTLLQDGGATAKVVRQWMKENPSLLTPRRVTLCRTNQVVYSRPQDPYRELVEESASAKLG